MKIDISFKAAEGWTVENEVYTDENGVEISNIEADCDADGSFVEVHAGPMPEGETAEDQAFANYAESVGFDDDSEDSPIVKFKFNGKNAWGFDALCEDDKPLRLICQEAKSGVLTVIILGAADDDKLEDLTSLVETKLRINILK